MTGQEKDRAQLLLDLEEMHQLIATLERAKSNYGQVVEDLRESEGLWRSMCENSPDHVMLLDRDYKIRQLNYTVPDLTREQVIGKSNFDFLSPDCRKLASDCFARVVQSGKTERFETKFVTSTGETQYFDVRISPLLDRTGEITGFINTSHRIPEEERVGTMLQHLVRSTVAVTGEECFNIIIRELCRLTGADCALIGEISGQRVGKGTTVRSLAMVLDGNSVSEFEYSLGGTPC